MIRLVQNVELTSGMTDDGPKDERCMMCWLQRFSASDKFIILFQRIEPSDRNSVVTAISGGSSGSRSSPAVAAAPMVSLNIGAVKAEAGAPNIKIEQNKTIQRMDNHKVTGDYMYAGDGTSYHVVVTAIRNF